MSVCSPGQKPYQLFNFPDLTGDSPAEACSGMVGYVFGGGTWTGASWGTTCVATGHSNPSSNGDWGGVVQVCDPESPGVTPTVVVCESSCTVSHVVSVEFPSLALTTSEGGAIAAAVVAVWVVGWAFKQARRALNVDSVQTEEKES
ncbi:MAG: hypothetical protein Q7U84_10055 [Polynucleobacter sp.]|nr:hypothetical protein [Polynucleobacter sp.]